MLSIVALLNDMWGPGNGIHMTLPMELFSIPFPTQCFTSVFLTVSIESQSKWWLFRLSFHNQCILGVLWWWKNHPYGQVDPKHSSEGHTVCPEVFKWRNKNFQWDLQRMKGHASGGQNMFCLKSYIEGKRIHQLGSLGLIQAESTKLPNLVSVPLIIITYVVKS